MSVNQNRAPRVTSDQKNYFYVTNEDGEPYKYLPREMHNNSYYGTWSRVMELPINLNFEMQQKYWMDYQAHNKAHLEIGSSPLCFDECVENVTNSSLSSDEKNCIRECYFKRVSSRDDMYLMFSYMQGQEQAKKYRNTLF